MTDLYNILNGNQQSVMPQQQMFQQPNMFQMMNEFQNAMRNPLNYIMQRFPDIPVEMQNDPNRMLAYLQQTRGITNQDMQQMYSFINQFFGRRI